MQSDVIAVSTSHLRPYLLDNLIQHKITEPVFPVIREIKVVRVKGHGARVLLAERPNRACPAVHFRVEAAPVGVIQRHFPDGVNQHTAAQGVVIVAQRAGSVFRRDLLRNCVVRDVGVNRLTQAGNRPVADVAAADAYRGLERTERRLIPAQDVGAVQINIALNNMIGVHAVDDTGLR